VTDREPLASYVLRLTFGDHFGNLPPARPPDCSPRAPSSQPPRATVSYAPEGLLEVVEAMLADVGASPQVEAAILEYTRSKIAAVAELADALADPEDEDELYRSAAFLWLELKSEWVRYNQTMQYQVARRGEAEPTVFVKGAVCAQFLMRIEPLLLPCDVDMLTTMSAEPLQFGKADVERIRRFLAHQDEVMTHIGRLFHAASQSPLSSTLEDAARDGTRLPTKLSALAERYERLLETMIRETHDALLVPYELLWPTHLSAIEVAATAGGLRVQVTSATSAGTRFDLRLARAAEDLIGASARALFELVKTGGEGHANVCLTVQSDDRATSYSLWSDRAAGGWADGSDSPARAELFALAERARATAILDDLEDRAVLTITVPHGRLAAPSTSSSSRVTPSRCARPCPTSRRSPPPTTRLSCARFA
jgi:hypothetical protein